MSKKYNTTTKSYIVNALLELLKIKSYNDINISELCETAGVGRMSFYRSYKNKDEVLKEYIKSEFDNWHKETEAKGTYNLMLEIFNFFYVRKDLIDLLFKSNLDTLIQDRILETCGYYIENDPNYLSYTKSMFAYSIFGWCKSWYEKGMQESPEELISLFNNAKEETSKL